MFVFAVNNYAAKNIRNKLLLLKWDNLPWNEISHGTKFEKKSNFTWNNSLLCRLFTHIFSIPVILTYFFCSALPIWNIFPPKLDNLQFKGTWFSNMHLEFIFCTFIRPLFFIEHNHNTEIKHKFRWKLCYLFKFTAVLVEYRVQSFKNNWIWLKFAPNLFQINVLSFPCGVYILFLFPLSLKTCTIGSFDLKIDPANLNWTFFVQNRSHKSKKSTCFWRIGLKGGCGVGAL